VRKAGAAHNQLREARGGHYQRRVLPRLVRRLLVLPVGASGAANPAAAAAIPAAAAAAAAAAADAAAVAATAIAAAAAAVAAAVAAAAVAVAAAAAAKLLRSGAARWAACCAQGAQRASQA
jgi:hypothetical protein